MIHVAWCDEKAAVIVAKLVLCCYVLVLLDAKESDFLWHQQHQMAGLSMWY